MDKSVILIANSIGAYFAMNGLADNRIEKEEKKQEKTIKKEEQRMLELKQRKRLEKHKGH